MIRYALICAFEHSFEGWFSSAADYDTQSAQGLLCCPVCETSDIEKAIMAPAVRTARKREAASDQRQAMLLTAAAEIREKIATNCEDVGENFAREARAIHKGEAPERGIYGSANAADAEALMDDGITAQPLPDILVPKPKSKLN